jgi:hypothetical protein
MSETRDERITRIAAMFPDGDLAYLLARLAIAEAGADRLADDLTCAQEQWGDEYLWQKWELGSALRLHAEAIARREQL